MCLARVSADLLLEQKIGHEMNIQLNYFHFSQLGKMKRYLDYSNIQFLF